MDIKIYINGEKQGSSLIDIKHNKYSFIKELQSYKIDLKALKIGENSIFIRSLNSIRKDHSLNTFHLSHHSNNRFEDHDPELSMDRHLPRSFFKYRNLD